MSGEHTEPNVSSQEKVVERIKWSELSDGEKKKIRTEVLEAILNGEISKVKALIRKYNGLKLAYYNYDGFKVQECMHNNEERDNPLHLAAFHGHLQIVKYLIEQDYCERECRNRFKNTPLNRAAIQGQLEVVRYLIEERNCDPMCVSDWGRTPLHNACRYSQLKVVEYLMSLQGINVNARDTISTRSTPLDLAAGYGSVDVVSYLVHDKNCYDPANYEGFDTPLHFAAYRGNLPVVKYLVGNRDFKVNMKGWHNMTPFHSACRGGKLEVVKYLINFENAGGDARDKSTPFELVAAGYGSVHIVRYMNEDRHCYNPRKYEGSDTPLHYAAMKGNLPWNFLCKCERCE